MQNHSYLEKTSVIRPIAHMLLGFDSSATINTKLVAILSWNKSCFFVNSPGGRDTFWRIPYSWAQSSHSGSSDDRKFGPSTQRPLRMNVFVVTPGEASSVGLDLLSLCTSNGMG